MLSPLFFFGSSVNLIFNRFCFTLKKSKLMKYKSDEFSNQGVEEESEKIH